MKKGECIETHQSEEWDSEAMTKLRDGSIVTAHRNVIEIRQL